MSLFNAYEAIILNHINGVTAFTADAHLHLALSTTTPAEDGTNITEPVANGYAHIQVDNDDVTWDTATVGATSNLIALTWPKATGSWGTCTYVVALGADDTAKRWFAAIDGGTGIAIGNNEQFSIPIGDLDMTAD